MPEELEGCEAGRCRCRLCDGHCKTGWCAGWVQPGWAEARRWHQRCRKVARAAAAIAEQPACLFVRALAQIYAHAKVQAAVFAWESAVSCVLRAALAGAERPAQQRLLSHVVQAGSSSESLARRRPLGLCYRE